MVADCRLLWQNVARWAANLTCVSMMGLALGGTSAALCQEIDRFAGPDRPVNGPPDRLMEALDTDGNGELSEDELNKAPELLRKLDANTDGKLSFDETLPAGMRDRFGPGGFGPGGGPGGGRGFGPGGGERKLVAQFDIDKDGRLNAAERLAARQANGGREGGRRGRGGFGGRMSNSAPQPGAALQPADVTQFPDRPLYDPDTLRTLFLTFESADWEAELEAFNNTDVEVPATLVVDGKTYTDVGVHFRGMSSYMMVPTGMKRSLNVSLDFVDDEQRLYGYKTLNLLNAHEDDSFLSTVLYSELARKYIPAPRANFVRVVINGESWGVYVNVQQFDKVFLKENYETTGGTRWKVSGSPGADGGLRYLGEDIDEYRRRYAIKSKENERAWNDLVGLCRTLNTTPVEQLETALAPILDLDEALWFLALDCVLVNGDGYWTRASDYSIYQDELGKFHLTPHDMNEAMRSGRGGPGGPGGPGGRPGRGFGGPFGPPGEDDRRADVGSSRDGGPQGPVSDERFAGEPEQFRGRQGGGPGAEGGFRGGRGGGFGGGRGGFGPPGMGGTNLDPLVGIDNERTPLRSKLLAVPALKARYLNHVRTLADKALDWNTVAPRVAHYRHLLAADIQADTRKLSSYEAFLHATHNSQQFDDLDARASAAATESAQPTTDAAGGLEAFFTRRRTYLLNLDEVKTAVTVSIEEHKSPTVASNMQKLQPLMSLNDTPRPTASSPLIVINELMASNSKTIADPQGEYDDWIELYNPTGSSVNLSGMYLTDSDRAPRKWSFPADAVIEPRGYLVVWADEDGKAVGGIHLNFKLSAKGEHVFLVDSDDRGNAVLDQVHFEKQNADVSFGRQRDGDGAWQPLAPTPGGANRERE
ncbi:MAG: CotH kinase family protein [Planctomycetales bacterium]|nr:CotH kinase family protein [Planctomycetales bacterium]